MGRRGPCRRPPDHLSDILAIWRDRADDVSGRALDCGNFLMEERPQETVAAIRGFHAIDQTAGESAVS